MAFRRRHRHNNPGNDPARTALNDQTDAAARDAHQAVDALHALDLATGDAESTLSTGVPPLWLLDQLAYLHARIQTGTAAACPHLHPDAPQVVHAAVWAPRQVRCTACAPQLMPDAGEDLTCDRCRQVAGVLHPGTLASGPLLLAFGLCPDCHRTVNRRALRTAGRTSQRTTGRTTGRTSRRTKEGPDQ